MVNLVYILASVLFIFGLKMLGSPETAKKGNLVSAIGMLIAVVVTLLDQNIVDYTWILIGITLGTIIGATAALRVKMTAMPEMVAIFNGFGGIASLLVGSSEYLVSGSGFDSLIPIYLTVVIGGITFTGSLIAYSKLSGVITGNPVLYKGQQWVNAILVLILFYLGIEMVASQDWLLVEDWQVISSIVALAFLLGVLLVIPIGGADMPVVIALLNSYSGLAACAAGFVIENNVLIVAGALVGASGLILTNIMCKAMNRSLANVLFSGFGSVSEGVSETGEQGEARPIISEDAYLILEAATSVAIVPGYGMAVAQAQHAVRELGELMEANGADVQYVIHPVAGRMPGHMNVLLAEANVPYDKLMEPEDINPIIETIDVCIVIGANDVVNPAAREDPNSPIFGMPIIDVDHAVTTFVLKRSMASGFAGIENPLFFKTNTRMLFGDAKDSITALVSEFKS
ncbi:MAG TPA: NAD(P)(+) transhydrogenase (Re/Si-specific) subunit beta [Gammaproteobacteria bacterium]|jgi:NAD(P) transhydrogenase subunit beta|nr:NAD(P)(+) transhydrogenase (Re/Si-specific) subunit beta [Gammaproteobacteria bacterium]